MADPWREPGLDGAVETALALARVVEQVRGPGDLVPALTGAAAVAAETLGYGGVSIDLTRPATDDVHAVVTVGSAQPRRTTSRSEVDHLLDARFTRLGCQVVDDALVIALRSHDGRLLGLMHLEGPADGRAPDDARLELAAIIARHAAHAVEEALRLLRAEEHRQALLRLVAISGRLHEQDPDQVLASICDAIHGSLAFGRVAITLTEDGAAAPRSSVGWSAEELAAWTTPAGRLLDPRHERAGCHLIAVPTATGVAERAWHHRLLVALRAPEGDLIGVIWVDEPDDGLVPDDDRLRALRLFADQATLAVLDARRRDELHAVARHDPLTGLGNRVAFLEALEQSLAEARDREHRTDPPSLLLLDLDHFKGINDTRGHLAGDDALRRVARTARTTLRAGDEAFRIGGDEFAVLLPATGRGEGDEVAGRLRARLRDADVPASFGIAVAQDGEDARAFMARTDHRLIAAKQARTR